MTWPTPRPGLNDAAGRLDTVTYPETTAGIALGVKHLYNAQGYLTQVKNNSTGASFWQANAQNADGNLLSEPYGNGVVTTLGYDTKVGRLTSFTSLAAGPGNSVRKQTYHYDTLGNLDSREVHKAMAGGDLTRLFLRYDKPPLPSLP